MRAIAVFAFAAACGTPVVSPAPVGPVPATPDPKPPATPVIPKDQVDGGAFLFSVSGTNARRETFSIRKLASGNLVLSATTENLNEKLENSGGEIELDAQLRPLRGSWRDVDAADGKNYKLGGDPLTLEMTRDDGRDPLKLVAKKPIDAHVQGPGIVAMTALCRVANEALLVTFGDEELPMGYLEAYVGAPVGELKRVVVNISDFDFEIVCSGDKLIAGGLAQFAVWFVREGREADLTALQKAPRPVAHAWKSPQDESERWKTYHSWLVDKKLLVTRDARRRMQRLTAFDVSTGREVAHRDFKTKSGTHIDCAKQSGGHLFCIAAEDGFMRLLDARTLADVEDFAPIVTKAIPNTDPTRWSIERSDADTVNVIIDDERMALVDTKKRNAISAPMPTQRNFLAAPDPSRCDTARSEGAKVGKELWVAEVAPSGTRIKRSVGTKPLPPIDLPLKYATLLTCAPRGFAAYAITYDEAKSVIALLGIDGKINWQVALEAHPDDIRVNGADLLLTTHEQNRRVLAIDPKKGAIKWTAKGPLPAQ